MWVVKELIVWTMRRIKWLVHKYCCSCRLEKWQVLVSCSANTFLYHTIKLSCTIIAKWHTPTMHKLFFTSTFSAMRLNVVLQLDTQRSDDVLKLCMLLGRTKRDLCTSSVLPVTFWRRVLCTQLNCAVVADWCCVTRVQLAENIRCRFSQILLASSDYVVHCCSICYKLIRY